MMSSDYWWRNISASSLVVSIWTLFNKLLICLMSFITVLGFGLGLGSKKLLMFPSPSSFFGNSLFITQLASSTTNLYYYRPTRIYFKVPLQMSPTLFSSRAGFQSLNWPATLILLQSRHFISNLCSGTDFCSRTYFCSGSTYINCWIGYSLFSRTTQKFFKSIWSKPQVVATIWSELAIKFAKGRWSILLPNLSSVDLLSWVMS